jgi:hypothetical protein
MKANDVIDAQTNARAEAWGLAWLCPLRLAQDGYLTLF